MNRKSSLPVLCGGFRSVAIQTKDARCTKRGSSYEGNGPSIEQHIPSIGNCKRRGGFGGRVQSLTFFVKGGFHGCCLRGFLDVPGPPLGLKALLLLTAFTRALEGPLFHAHSGQGFAWQRIARPWLKAGGLPRRIRSG